MDIHISSSSSSSSFGGKYPMWTSCDPLRAVPEYWDTGPPLILLLVLLLHAAASQSSVLFFPPSFVQTRKLSTISIQEVWG